MAVQASNLRADPATRFVELLTAHQRDLYAYINTLLVGDSSAADVLQDTNLDLWSRLDDFDFDRPFLPWAYGFAYQRVLAFRKTRGRSRLVFNDEFVQLPPPDWLTEQFENTGVDIGLDEGAWFRGDTAHTTAFGGGQSIDNVFSVWQRRCDTPQSLKLGAMGTRPGARAMYGIAGKPLD